MKIMKYQKRNDNNYLIYLDNGEKLLLHEDTILENKLLYKKEIDTELYNTLIKSNNKYDIYNRCVKYIGVRLRSINEIREYMLRKDIPSELIDSTIDRLISNRLLDDEVFTKAFINDKLNFTTMGPYRIEQELKKHKIDNQIISKYISNIDYDLLEEKINKQICKLIKSNKKKTNLKNRIYNNLLNLGYSNSFILENLNNYDL